jgi:hypothetical protein
MQLPNSKFNKSFLFNDRLYTKVFLAYLRSSVYRYPCGPKKIIRNKLKLSISESWRIFSVHWEERHSDQLLSGILNKSTSPMLIKRKKTFWSMPKLHPLRWQYHQFGMVGYLYRRTPLLWFHFTRILSWTANRPTTLKMRKRHHTSQQIFPSAAISYQKEATWQSVLQPIARFLGRIGFSVSKMCNNLSR